MSRGPRALMVALAIVVSSCGGDDGIGPPPLPPAEPGPVDFDVTTPGDIDDGGLLLTIVGGPVDSVTGLAGYEVFHSQTAVATRAIVYGSIGDGALMRVWVPNASLASRYTVRVDEGARRVSYDVVPGAAYLVTRRP